MTPVNQLDADSAAPALVQDPALAEILAERAPEPRPVPTPASSRRPYDAD